MLTSIISSVKQSSLIWLRVGIISWLLLLLLPLTQKDQFDVLTKSIWLFGLYLGLLLFGLLALSATFMQDRLQKWPEPTLPMLWGGAFLFSLVNLHIGDQLFNAPFGWQLAFYGFVILGVITILAHSLNRYGQPQSQVAAKPTRTQLGVSIALGLLTFGHNLFVLWGYGITVDNDSVIYMSRWSWIFNREFNYGYNHYTLPYKALNAVFSTFVNPYPLVFFQIILAAIAVGFFVYVMAYHDFLIACLSGLILALNITMAAQMSRIGTQGLSSITLILLVAFMMEHYRRRESVKVYELFLWGMVLTFGLTTRPSNVYLLGVVILAYLVILPDWRKTGSFVVGTALMFLLVLNYTSWRYGSYQLTQIGSGFYMAWPMLTYQVFEPENGSASQELHNMFLICNEDFDQTYKSVGLDSSNDYLWDFARCTYNGQAWTIDEAAGIMASAYFEGILANPFRFAHIIAVEHSRFLEVAPVIGAGLNTSNSCPPYLKEQTYQACTKTDRLNIDDYPNQTYVKITQPLNQLYMMLALPKLSVFSSATPTQSISIAAAWLILVIFALFITRGSIQIAVAAIFVLSYYISFSIVVGHVLTVRYTAPMDSFYGVLSVITLVTIGRYIYQGRTVKTSPFETIFELVKPRQILRNTVYLSGILVIAGIIISTPQIYQKGLYKVFDAVADVALTNATIMDYYIFEGEPPDYLVAANRYLAEDLEGELVFNPRKDNLNWPAEFVFINEAVISSEMAQAFANWRTDLNPCELTSQNIHYLLLDYLWASYRPDLDLITTGEGYQLVQHWEGDTSLGEYINLYQLSCSETQ